MSRSRNRLALALGTLAVGALALTACGGSSDPLTGGGDEEMTDSTTINVGSQAYYSNEIIAEIYAQALENAG